MRKYLLQDSDWVVWMNCDCLVGNMTLSPNHLLQHATANTNLILLQKNNMIHTDVIAIRNCEWSRSVLSNWYGSNYSSVIDHPLKEAAAIYLWLQHQPAEAKDRVVTLHHGDVVSYPQPLATQFQTGEPQQLYQRWEWIAAVRWPQLMLFQSSLVTGMTCWWTNNTMQRWLYCFIRWVWQFPSYYHLRPNVQSVPY